MMRRIVLYSVLCGAAMVMWSIAAPRGAGDAAAQSRAPYGGWAAYGGSVDQIRYSSLRQITAANVAQLRLAWTYDSGESGGLQTQPIVVGNVLYAYTPTHKAFAIR